MNLWSCISNSGDVENLYTKLIYHYVLVVEILHTYTQNENYLVSENEMRKKYELHVTISDQYVHGIVWKLQGVFNERYERASCDSILAVEISSETTNPNVTRKPDNPLKGIRNTVPNGIRSQWPRGLTIPT